MPLEATGVESRFGFTGNWTDPVTGFVYLRARDYDPQTRQFFRVDPALDLTGQPYAYAGNNPLTVTDPLGLFGFEAIGSWFDDVTTSAYHGLKSGPGVAVTSFVVGFGDAISFGLAESAREALSPGSSCQVIKDGFYSAGGLASSLVPIPGLGVAAAALKVGAVAVAGAATVVIKAIPATITSARALPSALIGSTVMAARTTTSVGGRVGTTTSSAASSVANSFVPGTKVLMADGTSEPIEHIEIGDEVWAADPESGEAGARPVTALIEGEGVKDLVTVSTGSGSVVATAGHPFWSVSDAAWVDAGDLSVGDAVLQADGATSVVTQVVEVSRPAVVHNLTVADLHTYFVVVGDAPTLVHNCAGGGGWLGSHADDPWPGNGGFVGTPRTVTLEPGVQIDRFGDESGSYVAPNGTPISQRSLRPGSADGDYNVYEVTSPLDVLGGQSLPWFGERGMGVQYQLPASVSDLLDAGYLRRIT